MKDLQQRFGFDPPPAPSSQRNDHADPREHDDEDEDADDGEDVDEDDHADNENGRKARTRVVHCKRAKFDVYVGRPSKWGNPFEIGRDGNRDTVIKKYREWIVDQPSLLAALPEISGKTIGCWCSPRACHGDILAELADKSAGAICE